jgi:Asp-tRNA(Asn)/Glu-tRNA(Gln) amidotransferase B subunit
VIRFAVGSVKGKGVVQEVRSEGAVRVDVRGSVHHATILTIKNLTRYNSVSKSIISYFNH